MTTDTSSHGSILLGVGSEFVENRRKCQDNAVSAVFQFFPAGSQASRAMIQVAPLLPNLETYKQLKHEEFSDPTPLNPWTPLHIDEIVKMASKIVGMLKKGQNVMIICQAGKNRSRTLAGIAHRIYKVENLVEPKGDVIPLPEDETLAAFVKVFDEGDPIVREKLLSSMRDQGIQGQRRAKRSRVPT